MKLNSNVCNIYHVSVVQASIEDIAQWCDKFSLGQWFT